METFWSLKSIPELAAMPKKERKKIWRRGLLKSFRNWQTWTAFAICAACAASGVIIGHTISDTNTTSYIGAGLGGAIGGAVFGFISVKMTVLNIREYLDSHDEVRRT